MTEHVDDGAVALTQAVIDQIHPHMSVMVQSIGAAQQSQQTEQMPLHFGHAVDGDGIAQQQDFVLPPGNFVDSQRIEQHRGQYQQCHSDYQPAGNLANPLSRSHQRPRQGS